MSFYPSINGTLRFSMQQGLQFLRCASTEASSSQLAVLILGNSNIGNHIAETSINQGHEVFVTTRSALTAKKTTPIRYIHTPTTALTTPQFWQYLAKEHLPLNKRLLIINTIGGSVAEPGQSMEDLNIHIPKSAIQGILEEIDKRDNQDYSFVHLSTSAAENLDAPYGKTKREGERCLMDLPINRLTILRMSYVAEAFFKDSVKQTFKEQHRLSAEEFALLPFTPLIGNPWDYKRVMLQPVSMDDVSAAAHNTFELPQGKRIIDAVGDQELTQEAFFKFYTDLLGKEFRPLFIPIKAADIMAQHHPFGHCTSYAVEFCAKDRPAKDPTEFKNLVGRRLQTLDDVYQTQSTKKFELVLPRPPLFKFGSVVMRNLLFKPASIVDTARAMGITAFSLIFNKDQPQLDLTGTKPPLASYKAVPMSEEDFSINSAKNRLCNP